MTKKTKTSPLTQRISKLIDAISHGMHEREEIMAVTLLAALSGQNTFLYGPPGTAKSLISRRLASAFDNPKYFECLMNRFTDPNEVVGPVSVKALKEDKYTRKTQGYLPEADFAFLDEIWKSSPAILNTLLTMINEHVFKNGDEIKKVPLKALISASNEVPQANQGLEALYDRFIVRMEVPPIQERANFDLLINSKPSSDKPEIDSNLKISQEEWIQWQQDIHDVSLSEETFSIIHMVRDELVSQAEELSIYVSDRRWQRAATLIKASAFFCGRTITNHSDAMLLKYCLWTDPDNREKVASIVENVIKATGFKAPFNMLEIEKRIDELDKDINKELYHQSDVYETYKLDGNKQYFRIIASFKSPRSYGGEGNKFELYLPVAEFKSKTVSKAVDKSGNAVNRVKVNFDGTGSCYLSYSDGYYRYDDITFTPKVMFKKGTKKQDVHEILLSGLLDKTKELKKDLCSNRQSASSKEKKLLSTINTPFISDKSATISLQGYETQIKSLDLKIKDCERLEALCL
ncbi:MAG: AAA family ATPase [Bermanella sp.]